MTRSVVDPRMRSYYDRRAGEYDDWWLGAGLFAALDRPGWAAEVSALIAVVSSLPPADVLDVACGTGFLTRHLRGAVVGLDQSPAMLTFAAKNAPGLRVVCGDAVPLPFPDGTFDLIFTSHFYGHLLSEERSVFLDEARRVARRLIIVDSARHGGAQAEEWQERTLNDGSRHSVYKRHFKGSELAAEIGGGKVLHDGQWFVVVSAEPAT
jgi:SAM-dependent methyltransferase